MLERLSAYTELIVSLAVLCAFLYPLLTLGIHAFLRDALELHLRASHSKRAMKDARRQFTAQRAFSGLLLEWQRTLAGTDDRKAQRICICNDVCMLLFPFGEAMCIAGYWMDAAAWAAVLLNVLALVMLAAARMIMYRMQRSAPHGKKHPVRHANQIRAARVLHSGYILPALILTLSHVLIPAGILLTANAVHLLILRAKKADLFYCTMQLADHRTVTPYHHTDGYRRHAERQGKRLAIILLVLGFGDLLLSVLSLADIL